MPEGGCPGCSRGRAAQREAPAGSPRPAAAEGYRPACRRQDQARRRAAGTRHHGRESGSGMALCELHVEFLCLPTATQKLQPLPHTITILGHVCTLGTRVWRVPTCARTPRRAPCSISTIVTLWDTCVCEKTCAFPSSVRLRAHLPLQPFLSRRTQARAASSPGKPGRDPMEVRAATPRRCVLEHPICLPIRAGGRYPRAGLCGHVTSRREGSGSSVGLGKPALMSAGTSADAWLLVQCGGAVLPPAPCPLLWVSVSGERPGSSALSPQRQRRGAPQVRPWVPSAGQPTQSLWAAVRTVFAAFADSLGAPLPGRWNQGPLTVSPAVFPGACVSHTAPEPGSRCIPSQPGRWVPPQPPGASALCSGACALVQREGLANGGNRLC